MPITLTIPLAIIFILASFWLWMFYEMLHNDDIPAGGQAGLSWPPQSQSHWIIFFVLLSLFTAGYYYFTTYREQ
jgi:hypothetical protein